MKLIAETQEESSKLNGLSALLLDLGIDVDSYENEEAIAVSFGTPMTICRFRSVWQPCPNWTELRSYIP